MTHQITIESIGINQEIEWRETVTAANKSAARRKANKAVKGWGDVSKIEKRTNQYCKDLEIWRLT
jgi:hypothetical protein